MFSRSTAASTDALSGWRDRLGLAVVLAAGGLFAVAVASYYHPIFGLTRFFQLQSEFAERALPEVASGRVFVHGSQAGYDGQFYSQLSLRPTLRDPMLQTAIDAPSMRARRILCSWIAAGLGAGDADRTLHAYAWINVVTWFLLGGVLLALFPPHNLRNVVAWLGLMGSCGVLTSVRYALTDLPALLLLAVVLWLLKRRPPGLGSAALMACATLTRETALLAGPALLPGGGWTRRLLRGTLLIAPLAAWVFYVRHTLGGGGSAGLANFDWPFVSWVRKIGESVGQFRSVDQDPYLWASVACLFSVTVQAGLFIVRPRWREPAWQGGIGYVVLFVFLGWPTFEGFPGSYTRILLPLHLTFNLLAVGAHRGLLLLVLGNLTVLAGLPMLGDGRTGDHEFAHGVLPDSCYQVTLATGWFGIERNDDHRWSWTSGEGDMKLRRYARSGRVASAAATGNLQIKLVGFVPADVTIRQGNRILWQGVAPREGRLVHLPLADLDFGADATAVLTFSSPTPAAPEAMDANARSLCFALYDPAFDSSPPPAGRL